MAESATDKYERIRELTPEDLPKSDSPRVGEQELAQWVESLSEEAAKARQRDASDDQWEDWEQGYWGDFPGWDVGSLPSHMLPLVVNDLKSLILQEISDLTDNKLRVYISRNPNTGERDDKSEKALQAEWQRQFFDLQVLLACLDAFIFPCGFLACTYDPTADQGQGKIIMRAVNPLTVFPDPHAEDDQHWHYVAIRETMALQEVRRIWADQGRRVTADDAVSLKMPQTQSWMSSLRQTISPLWSKAGSFETNPTYIKANAIVNHAFVYDDTLEDVKPTASDDGNVIRLSKRQVRPKYPYGRLIQVANGVVLYDGKNPYHGPFPYVRVLMQPPVHRFWPRSSVVGENLQTLRGINKLKSLLIENALRMNKGLVLLDADSGINKFKFAQNPGEVHYVNPSRKVEIKYPNPMPPDFFKLPEMLTQDLQRVNGFTQARAALGARGNVSAELTETEISQAMGMTRLRSRLLVMSVQKIVSMVFSRMAQFWTVPRVIPVIEGESFQPIAWSPIPDAKQYAAYVDPASFEVKSQTLLSRLTLTLLKMGLYPIEDAYTDLGIPGAKEKAAKVKQEMVLRAQARQQQRGKK